MALDSFCSASYIWAILLSEIGKFHLIDTDYGIRLTIITGQPHIKIILPIAGIISDIPPTSQVRLVERYKIISTRVMYFIGNYRICIADRYPEFNIIDARSLNFRVEIFRVRLKLCPTRRGIPGLPIDTAIRLPGPAFTLDAA
jgi:hypothetical protein